MFPQSNILLLSVQLECSGIGLCLEEGGHGQRRGSPVGNTPSSLNGSALTPSLLQLDKQNLLRNPAPPSLESNLETNCCYSSLLFLGSTHHPTASSSLKQSMQPSLREVPDMVFFISLHFQWCLRVPRKDGTLASCTAA